MIGKAPSSTSLVVDEKDDSVIFFWLGSELCYLPDCSDTVYWVTITSTTYSQRFSSKIGGGKALRKLS